MAVAPTPPTTPPTMAPTLEWEVEAGVGVEVEEAVDVGILDDTTAAVE